MKQLLLFVKQVFLEWMMCHHKFSKLIFCSKNHCGCKFYRPCFAVKGVCLRATFLKPWQCEKKVMIDYTLSNEWGLVQTLQDSIASKHVGLLEMAHPDQKQCIWLVKTSLQNCWWCMGTVPCWQTVSQWVVIIIPCWQTPIQAELIWPSWQVHTKQKELAAQCFSSQAKAWDAAR